MERQYGGNAVQTNDEGFLTDIAQWNREVGSDIATEEGITMSDDHWKYKESGLLAQLGC